MSFFSEVSSQFYKCLILVIVLRITIINGILAHYHSRQMRRRLTECDAVFSVLLFVDINIARLMLNHDFSFILIHLIRSIH